jgi:malate dehydrogenase (oxaloacetate-decarboxylating)
VKKRIAFALGPTVLACERLLGSPSLVDLGVFAVLANVVVEVVPPGRESGDDEIGFVRTAVGENDSRLTAALKQVEHFGRERSVKVGSPDRAAARGIFDNGARVTDQGGVDTELASDRPGTPVTPACAKHRTDPRSGRASDGRQRTGPQRAIRVEQSSVNIKRQDLKAMSRHSPPTKACLRPSKLEAGKGLFRADPSPACLIVSHGMAAGQGQSTGPRPATKMVAIVQQEHFETKLVNDAQPILPDPNEAELIEVPYSGRLLLGQPLLNKGTAFDARERRELGLLGLLPPHEDSIEQQADRCYLAYQEKPNDLERHIYLRQLQDTNETLFYHLLLGHLAEMMPIIYTPTVGLACERFSRILRRPRGLFLAYNERSQIDEVLDNSSQGRVDVIVVTDGERILGLGDQGAGGMGIPIGKLSLYTACGGIDPATTLPILLDAGTNNAKRLSDPLYIGWRHERLSEPVYDDFVDLFVRAIERKFPGALLQWEDFAQANAIRLLDRYRGQLCTFNDDIQGTAAVVLGTLLAALSASGARLRDQSIAILGAGSAGCGIAEQLVTAMVEEGTSEREARARLYLCDRPGLLHDGLTELRPFQRKLAQKRDRIESWRLAAGEQPALLDVVTNAMPTILIGVSGQPGAFTEEIVRALASRVQRPIIFPLSNPNSRAEAVPADLIEWTEGRALVATGSPFDDVKFRSRDFPIAQCNNSYVFPGLGLGVRACGANRVSDGMFMAAARMLAACSPARLDAQAGLLPPLSESRQLARSIALAVALAAIVEGLATPRSTAELEARIDATMWWPRYLPMKKKQHRLLGSS